MSDKVTDILKNSDGFSISIEVMPVMERFEESQADDLAALECTPNFIAVSWGLADRDWQNTWKLNIAPIRLSKQLKAVGKNVLLHLSCDLLSIPYLESVLKDLQENGICNLFIVDDGQFDTPIRSASHLIKFIREFSGDFFCIGVPGSPYSDHNELVNLKENIDAGADFIITEAIFEAKTFTDFRRHCEELAIDVPIIAGIYLIETDGIFSELDDIKVKIPIYLRKQDAPNSYYAEMLSKLIQDIMPPTCDERKKTYLHFYSTYENVSVTKDKFLLETKNKLVIE